MSSIETIIAFFIGFALGMYVCFGLIVRVLVRKAKKDPRLKTILATLIEESDEK